MQVQGLPGRKGEQVMCKIASPTTFHFSGARSEFMGVTSTAFHPQGEQGVPGPESSKGEKGEPGQRGEKVRKIC